ncbi:hypothetical protein CPB86DRAFT_595087 [Serendipita vermifera]|nr:hypothetical protein CPB86DRAFT_595087 [Serendipita vermifera]
MIRSFTPKHALQMLPKRNPKKEEKKKEKKGINIIIVISITGLHISSVLFRMRVFLSLPSIYLLCLILSTKDTSLMQVG